MVLLSVSSHKSVPLMCRWTYADPPQSWVSHITIKQMHFEAAAQYRLSQEDLEKNRYGEEIARLRVAEGLAKKGLDMSKSGVADAVIQDLKVREHEQQACDVSSLCWIVATRCRQVCVGTRCQG